MKRLRRILSTKGRTLIVALDHLSRPGRPTLADPQKVLDDVAGAGADAVLLRPGPAARCDYGRLALILSCGLDVSDTAASAPAVSVELALRLDAAALKLEVFPGSPDEEKLKALQRLAATAQGWNLPVLAEMIPVAFGAPETRDPEKVAAAARLGADLGASLVKVPPTERFQEITSYAGVPVVVLGGAPGDPKAMLQRVRTALDAGAAGAAVGRNISTHEHPGRLTEALAELIHGDRSVDQVLPILNREIVGA